MIPASARGAGFGLLTTASLVGLAVSPIVSGLLGATSIRAVFAPRRRCAWPRWRSSWSGSTGRGSASGDAARRTDDKAVSEEPVVSETLKAAPTCQRVIVVDPERRGREALLREPARLLREGRVVAFPTDTLYGLAVDPAERGRGPAAVRVEGTRGRLARFR